MNISAEFSDLLANFPDASLLAEGGQKAVFYIKHHDLGECVMKIGVYSHSSTLQRIQREVSILKDLGSDYFPKNLGFEIIDDHRFVIFEEYLNGRPLSEILDQYTNLRNAIELIREITSGLCILWAKNIVHRDLKPSNIIISHSGKPRIIDLGIARILDETSITLTFQTRGPATPIYAAPEQLLNKKDMIDPRTDQFAIGILLGQLILGGVHPFDPVIVKGPSIVENIMHCNHIQFSSIPAITPCIDLALQKLLGEEPHMRFRSGEILLSRLDECLRGY